MYLQEEILKQNIIMYKKRLKIKVTEQIAQLLPNSNHKQQMLQLINQYDGQGELNLNLYTDDQKVKKVLERECNKLFLAYKGQPISILQLVQIDKEIELLLFYKNISQYKNLIQKQIIEAILWPQNYKITWQQLKRMAEITKYETQLRSYPQFKYAIKEPISSDQLKEIYYKFKEPLNTDKLEVYLSSKQIQYPSLKQSILVIGRTGAGKTTNIQTILGYDHILILDPQTNYYTLQTTQPLKQKHKDLIAKRGSISVTSDIHIVKIGESLQERDLLKQLGIQQDLILADCPGLNDTRGKEVELANNYLRNRFLQKCEKIMVIQILNISIFTTERINNIRNFAQYLTKQYKFSNDQELAKSMILLYNNCSLKNIKSENQKVSLTSLQHSKDLNDIYLDLKQQIRYESDLKLKSAYCFMLNQLLTYNNLIAKVEQKSDKLKQQRILNLISQRMYRQTSSYINNFLNAEMQGELEGTCKLQRQKLLLYMQRRQFPEVYHQFKILELLHRFDDQTKMTEILKKKIDEEIVKYLNEIKSQLSKDTQYYFNSQVVMKILNYKQRFTEIKNLNPQFIPNIDWTQLQQTFGSLAAKLADFVCRNNNYVDNKQIKREYFFLNQYKRMFDSVKMEELANLIKQKYEQRTQLWFKMLYDYDLQTDDSELTKLEEIQQKYKSLCFQSVKVDIYNSCSKTQNTLVLLENQLVRKIKQIYKYLKQELMLNQKIYRSKKQHKQMLYIIYEMQMEQQTSDQPLKVLVLLQKVYKMNEMQAIKELIAKQQIPMPEEVNLFFRTVKQLIVKYRHYLNSQEQFSKEQIYHQFKQTIVNFKRDIYRVISSEITSTYFKEVIEQEKKLKELIHQKRSIMLKTLQQIQTIIYNNKFNYHLIKQYSHKVQPITTLNLYNQYLQIQSFQNNIEQTLEENCTNYFALQKELREKFCSQPQLDPKQFCHLAKPDQYMDSLTNILKLVIPGNSPIFNQISCYRQQTKLFINKTRQSLTRGILDVKVNVRILQSQKDMQEEELLLLFTNIQKFINFNFTDYQMTRLQSQQQQIIKQVSDLFEHIGHKIKELELRYILERKRQVTRHNEQAKTKFIEKMYSLTLELYKKSIKIKHIDFQVLLQIIEEKLKDFFRENIQEFKQLTGAPNFSKQELFQSLQIYQNLVGLIKTHRNSQRIDVYGEYQTLKQIIEHLFSEILLNKFKDQVSRMFQKFSSRIDFRFEVKEFDKKAQECKNDSQKLKVFTECFQDYIKDITAKLSKQSQEITINILSEVELILPRMRTFFDSQSGVLNIFQTELKKKFKKQKNFMMEECKKYIQDFKIEQAEKKLKFIQNWMEVIPNLTGLQIEDQIEVLQQKIRDKNATLKDVISLVDADDQSLLKRISEQDQESIEYYMHLVSNNQQFKSFKPKLIKKLTKILQSTSKKVEQAETAEQWSNIYNIQYLSVKNFVEFLFNQTIFEPHLRKVADEILRKVENQIRSFEQSLYNGLQPCPNSQQIQCSLQLCQSLTQSYYQAPVIVTKFRQKVSNYLRNQSDQLQTAKGQLKVKLYQKMINLRPLAESLSVVKVNQIYLRISKHFKDYGLRFAKALEFSLQDSKIDSVNGEELSFWLSSQLKINKSNDFECNSVQEASSIIHSKCRQIVSKYRQKYDEVLLIDTYQQQLQQNTSNLFEKLQQEIIFCYKYQYIKHLASNRESDKESKIIHFLEKLEEILEVFLKFQIHDNDIFVFKQLFSNQQAILTETEKIGIKFCFLNQCIQKLPSLSVVKDHFDKKLIKYCNFKQDFLQRIKQLGFKLVQDFIVLVRQDDRQVNNIINFNVKGHFLYTLLHRILRQCDYNLENIREIHPIKHSNQFKKENMDQKSENNSSSQSQVLILEENQYLVQNFKRYFLSDQKNTFRYMMSTIIKSAIKRALRRPIKNDDVVMYQDRIISRNCRGYTYLVGKKRYIQFLEFPKFYTSCLAQKLDPFAIILYSVGKLLNRKFSEAQVKTLITLVIEIQKEAELGQPLNNKKLILVEFQHKFIIKLMIAFYFLGQGKRVHFQVRDPRKYELLQQKLSSKQDSQNVSDNHLTFGSLDSKSTQMVQETNKGNNQVIFVLDFQSVFQPIRTGQPKGSQNLLIFDKRFKCVNSFNTIFMFKASPQIDSASNSRVTPINHHNFNLQMRHLNIQRPRLGLNQGKSYLLQEIQQSFKGSADSTLICFANKENLYCFLKDNYSQLSPLKDQIVVADNISETESIDNLKWESLGVLTKCLLTTREMMVDLDPLKIKKVNSSSSYFFKLILCYEPIRTIDYNLMESIMKFLTDRYKIDFIVR